MRILAKTCLILAVCLMAAQGARAADSDRPFLHPRNAKVMAFDPEKPFVMVSIPDKPLYLGEVYGPSLKEVGAQVTARVVANCPYHISASFDGLRHQRSRVEISPKHLTATLNGKPLPIGGRGRVPVASQGPTPPGGVELPLELQVGVKAMASYPAGRYGGTLVITVTAGH